MKKIKKNIEEYNPNQKSKLLIVFDDMIADMLSNKKCEGIITELFVRSKKLNISTKFYALFYCEILLCKQGLQQITFNYLADIDIKDFMDLLP